MDPYLVLDVDETANDEQLEARYRLLLKRYPPDRDPERFALVRRAFEELRDLRSRMRTYLFRHDETGTSLARGIRLVTSDRERGRLEAEDLERMIDEEAPWT